ncbi:MAG: dihydroorotase [Patescibacteria group bacterium]|jgi:dihydroorotase|nr:dihydroorotase [Patescibacteria group bacterium]
MTTIEGIIVNTEGQNRRRIEIDDSGIITKVAEPTGVADVVFKDELIFPGFIDLHVHAREDQSGTQIYKEDFVTAGEAAINGGVVAFAEMPNNPVPPVDDESYNIKKELTKKSDVEIILYAGIGQQTNPLAQNVPYKVFMGQSIGDLFFATREDLENALAKYEGKNISFHCEDPATLNECCDRDTHEHKRPPEAEILAVDFALELIEKYNLKGRICHCSTKEGVEMIIDAKKRGVNVTVEVTPHHLYFDESMFTESNHTLFQVNPPIRQTIENRLYLIQALKNGDIDQLGTDHAPHTRDEKEKGISGLTHLDTYGNIVAWLIKEHNFTPQEITRVCSENPAKFINECTTNKYGRIEEGFVGSLTVIDMNKKILIESANLKTKCKWSPFLGVEFPGSVVATIIKGIPYQSKA